MKAVRKFLSLVVSITLIAAMASPAFAYDDTVNISDYLAPDTGADAADIIQKLIDDNPNRTIVFPDGEYLVSKPILTSADPDRSVSLKMTDYTVIRAVGDWKSGEAVIQLGGKEKANTTHYAGSNYSLEAGVIDCSGVADGVSINSGRETAVRNTSIKNAVVGLHIMYGANNGSSDADITGVNIIGTGKKDSIGVLLEGYDNTLTNMRIGFVHEGVVIKSSGNMLRNIHPLFYSDITDYPDSRGFVICGGDNWLDYCYSDEFATGFYFETNSRCTLNDCYCYWYSDFGDETAIEAESEFNSVVTNFRAGFQGSSHNTVLKTGSILGSGSITSIDVSNPRISDIAYRGYLGSHSTVIQPLNIICRIFSLFAILFGR